MVHTCPDPAACPVASFTAVKSAPTSTVAVGTIWWRIYDNTYGFDEPNPGPKGNTRFAPIFETSGASIPTMYLAQTDEAAALETVFRFADAATPAGAPVPPAPVVFESTFYKNLLIQMANPVALRLFDLSDIALAALGVPRGAVSSSGMRHYPCTQRLAEDIYIARPDLQGILWDSRQAEMHQAAGHLVGPAAVAMLYTSRVPLGRGKWMSLPPGSLNLTTGAGRTRLDVIATTLGIDIVTS